MTPETFDAFALAAWDVLHAFGKHCTAGKPVDDGLVFALSDIASAYTLALGGHLPLPTRIHCDPRVVQLYAAHSLHKAFIRAGHDGVPKLAEEAFKGAFAPCLKVPPV